VSGTQPRYRAVPALLVGSLAAAVGCGGDDPPEPAEPVVVPTSGGESEPPPEPDDGLEVEGLLGTIDARDVLRAMERQHPAFLRCFTLGYDDTELVAGEVVFALLVGAHGQVTDASLASSTVGHRQTERCLLEAAEAVTFPRPQGGDRAELSTPFAIDLPEDVRPPVGWDAARVADVASAEAPAAREACGGGDGDVVYETTVYVGAGGQPLAAGVTRDPMGAPADELDCIAEAVRGWAFPDPGSYPAKVTFSFPAS